MVMVQEPQSAKYAGMPASAIATGLVDYILTTAEMPKQLVEYAHGPFLRRLPASTEGLVLPNEPMQKILILLRSHTGHDFSSYKTNTLRRRIERRMNVHQIRDSSQYIHYLQENSHELDILFKELLISVTSFFRDPEAWELFIAGPLSTLLQALPDEYTIRAWVPGCASGEEVYTLAISLRECMEKLNRKFGVQIFGTDLDADAIDTARAGKYPDGIAKDVVPVRLERNFSRNENAYQISKEIRDMAVFAEQNVIRDPPFTKLDLLLCRNLLIYLNSDLQKRLFPIFHYALKPGGLLLLGPSETIGSYTDLFETVDKRWKSYRRKKTATGVHPLPDIPTKLVLKGSSVTTPGETGAGTGQDLHISRFVEKLLSGRFAPASVVVNDRGEVVYVHGRTGAYLELMPGQPNHSVLEMAREGLKVDLALALRQATTQDDSVVRENIRVKTNGSYTHINLSVSRIHEPESIRGLLLVTFTEIPSPTPLVLPVAVSPKADVTYPKEDKTSHVAELERELQYARESLQRAAEELETSSEELKSTNEELQSNNEELQSINEELETSKEEMQSLNEELTTVNAELQMKVNDLSQATDDMQNLLNNTDIGTIFLDNELNIKWFTEQAKKLIKLRQTDMGRPISDLASNLDDTDLLQDCQVVLKTLVFNEKEVQSKDGLWYLMRIIPYRTVDNLINGLVLTFVNIHRLKVAQANLGRMSKVFMAAPDPILIVDLTGKIIDMNEESVRAFGFARDLMIAQSIHKAILSESYEQMDALLARCAAGETIRDIDRVRVNKAADEEIPVLLTLVLLTDDQGQADSIAIMIRRAVR
jgi:two-component system CheB/CheR fusion protein